MLRGSSFTAIGFVEVIENFEKGWGQILKRAIDVFIVLISEGSQADREKFISKFTTEYSKKYNDTYQKLITGNLISVQSEGGTLLYIDGKKTSAVLDIPSAISLKTEIYNQTFRVMGDEWGRKLSHNLIQRDQLIDLLRRSRTALQETPMEMTVDNRISLNLCIIYNSFINSYGTDANNVFRSIANEAGYEKTIFCEKNTKFIPATNEIKSVTIVSNVRDDNVQVCENYGPTRFNLNLQKGKTYLIKVSKPGYKTLDKTIRYNDVVDGGKIEFEFPK